MALTLADLAERMRDIDFAILSTRTRGGSIAGRPMSNNRQVEFDGDSYFFTCDESGTVADIAGDPNVGVTYQAKSGLLKAKPLFIAMEGRASLIRDRALFAEHWTKDLDSWFEQGIDTPGLVLVRVAAERIHYWDGYEEGELALAAQPATARS